VKNLKNIWLSAALLAPCMCTGMADAAPGDYADTVQRYGATNLSGADKLAVIGAQVGDLNQLEADIQAITGFECSRANACLVVKDRANGTSLLPSLANNVQAEERKVATAIAGVLVGAPFATVYFIDGLAKDQTNLDASVATLGNITGMKGFTATYTVATQTNITAFLSNHTGIVGVAPQGFFSSSLVVPIGGTQDVSGADAFWSTQDGGDFMVIMKSIPLPWGTQDSQEWGAGTALGLLDNQPSGGLPSRSTEQAASSSHFTPISSSTSPHGVMTSPGSL